MQQGRHIAQKFESGWEVGVIKAFDKKGPHAGKFVESTEPKPVYSGKLGKNNKRHHSFIQREVQG
jgi:hypothetical protein